jgi:hypothetical protein
MHFNSTIVYLVKTIHLNYDKKLWVEVKRTTNKIPKRISEIHTAINC